jgi:hypothetical protein
MMRWAAGPRAFGKPAGQPRTGMDLTDIAEARFREGYSCSQSVFSALAEG